MYQFSRQVEPKRGIAYGYATAPWTFLLAHCEPQADFHPCQDSAERFKPAPTG
ncbi:hypothetical protein [Pseudomonas phage DL52]|uniref:Uncharacterized protein n=1 Tax=Pseudomonas phage DL52 TaxID=1640975 RepID=A0A0F6YQA9_9CAUD|nr:hypothetical protein [Pseudomonas phage DL52]